MFRQLKGKAFREMKERETNKTDSEVIPTIGGTVEQHEARKHPLPAPCRAYDIAAETFGDLNDY